MTETVDTGKPRPGKAFKLSLLAPGLGHLYAGAPRVARPVAAVALSLLAVAVIAAMFPPTNLVVLVAMLLPLIVIPFIQIVAGIDAARKCREATAAGGSPVLFYSMGAGWIAAIILALGLSAAISDIGTFYTPNDDMAPTTLEGDFLVTWKDYYDAHLPERGDVTVVQLPGVEGDRIMRIIGLPGDNLLSVLGVLSINGAPIGRDGDGDFSWRDAGGTHRNASRYMETLPGGASYRILQSPEGMFTGTLFGASLRIPDGHYFVIGDNRDSSKSSWDFGMLPGLVLSDRPTVILSSSLSSLTGRSVQP